MKLNNLAMREHAVDKLTQNGVMLVFGLAFGLAPMLFVLGCVLRAFGVGE